MNRFEEVKSRYPHDYSNYIPLTVIISWDCSLFLFIFHRPENISDGFFRHWGGLFLHNQKCALWLTISLHSSTVWISEDDTLLSSLRRTSSISSGTSMITSRYQTYLPRVQSCWTDPRISTPVLTCVLRYELQTLRLEQIVRAPCWWSFFVLIAVRFLPKFPSLYSRFHIPCPLFHVFHVLTLSLLILCSVDPEWIESP